MGHIASIDWYGAQGQSRTELLNREKARNQLCPTLSADILPETVGQENLIALLELSNGLTDNSVELAASKEVVDLNGAWDWHSEDSQFKQLGSLPPAGIITLQDLGNGNIEGHAFTQTGFRREFKAAKGAMHINPTRISFDQN